jgi:hypothetical protein
MRCLLLICSDETVITGVSEAEMQASMVPWNAYTEELRKKGKMLVGEILELTASASTVRLGAGGITSNGPFAETKEQMGGFFVIEVESMKEATEWTARMPNIPDGSSVEVRRIMEQDRG